MPECGAARARYSAPRYTAYELTVLLRTMALPLVTTLLWLESTSAPRPQAQHGIDPCHDLTESGDLGRLPLVPDPQPGSRLVRDVTGNRARAARAARQGTLDESE